MGLGDEQVLLVGWSPHQQAEDPGCLALTAPPSRPLLRLALMRALRCRATH
jgi:hypothetical protein